MSDTWIADIDAEGPHVVKGEHVGKRSTRPAYFLDRRYEAVEDARDLANLLNERDRYRAALEKILGFQLTRGDEPSFYREYVRERATEALKDE